MKKIVSVLEQIGFRPTNSNELWSTTEVSLFNVIAKNIRKIGRLKIREENILIMKIRANDVYHKDAERFDNFSSVIINCKK